MRKIKNYYAILGVTRTATTSEIDIAYHRLMQYRPSLTRADEMSEAYFFLSDPKLRAWYDAELDQPEGSAPVGWKSGEWEAFSDKYGLAIEEVVWESTPNVPTKAAHGIMSRVPAAGSEGGQVLASGLLVLGPLIALIIILDPSFALKVFHLFAWTTDAKGKCADGSPSGGSLLALPLALLNIPIGLFAFVAFPGGLVYMTAQAFVAVRSNDNEALRLAVLAGIIAFGSVLLFAFTFQLMQSVTVLGC